MQRYSIAPAAERDISSILAWTHQQFGPRARLCYEALLLQCILDVAENPDRAGSESRPEIIAAARTYHLCHSRDRVDQAIGRVRRPRHFLLYRAIDDGGVEIGRVLHERMDLARHLPQQYHAKAAEGGEWEGG